MKNFNSFFREVNLFDPKAHLGRGALLFKFKPVPLEQKKENGKFFLFLDTRFYLERGGFVAKVCKVSRKTIPIEFFEIEQLVIKRYDGEKLIFLKMHDGIWKLVQGESEFLLHVDGSHALNMLLNNFKALEELYFRKETNFC